MSSEVIETQLCVCVFVRVLFGHSMLHVLTHKDTHIHTQTYLANMFQSNRQVKAEGQKGFQPCWKVWTFLNLTFCTNILNIKEKLYCFYCRASVSLYCKQRSLTCFRIFRSVRSSRRRLQHFAVMMGWKSSHHPPEWLLVPVLTHRKHTPRCVVSTPHLI